MLVQLFFQERLFKSYSFDRPVYLQIGGGLGREVAFALFNQLPRVQITALPRFFSLVPGLVDSIEIEPIESLSKGFCECS